MEPVVRKPLARDIDWITAKLNAWSAPTFQKFLESGVLSDVAEAIKKGKTGVLKIVVRGMFCPPRICGNVSFPQGKQFLDMLPVENWEQFVRAFSFWSETSGWWEENTPTWEMRDEWREEMELEPINPAFSSYDKDGKVIRVFLKKCGHQGDYPAAPKGYRYATLTEIKPYRISSAESILIQDGNEWISFHNGDQWTLDDMGAYVHRNTFFVPLVRE